METTYPKFEHTKNGVRVWISNKGIIPGYFLNELAAERALEQHLAAARVAQAKRNAKKANK